jgi:hypothetical protein
MERVLIYMPRPTEIVWLTCEKCGDKFAINAYHLPEWESLCNSCWRYKENLRKKIDEIHKELQA